MSRLIRLHPSQIQSSITSYLYLSSAGLKFGHRPEMRPLLALGNGHRRKPRASDHLRPLHRGGEAVQGVAASRSCRRHKRKLARHEVSGRVIARESVLKGRRSQDNAHPTRSASIVPSGRNYLVFDYQPLRSWLISNVAPRLSRRLAFPFACFGGRIQPLFARVHAMVASKRCRRSRFKSSANDTNFREAKQLASIRGIRG